MKKLRNITYEHKKSFFGFLFLLPWLLGAINFFLRPLIQTLWYSFCDIEAVDRGINVTFAGLKYYKQAFIKDQYFMPKFTEAFGSTLYQIPIIIAFSLLIAVILNKPFFGSTFFKTVFFLPVIISGGVILSVMNGDGFSDELLSGSGSSMMFTAASFEDMLLQSGMNEKIVQTMTYVINNIFELSWKSGVQILIFIAGLKTISASLYEVANIEGANGWETFWKVTFPLISPMLVLNVVYTIIDSFNDYQNPMMLYISKKSSSLEISYAAAMAWMYFLCILIIVGIVFAVLNKRAFSYTKR